MEAAGALRFGGPTVQDPEFRRQANDRIYRFTVLRNDTTEEIKGETRYVDGERDSEDDSAASLGAQLRPHRSKPTSTRSSTRTARRSCSTRSTLNPAIASCTSYWSGAMKVRKSRLEVPGRFFRRRIRH